MISRAVEIVQHQIETGVAAGEVNNRSACGDHSGKVIFVIAVRQPLDRARGQIVDHHIRHAFIRRDKRDLAAVRRPVGRLGIEQAVLCADLNLRPAVGGHQIDDVILSVGHSLHGQPFAVGRWLDEDVTGGVVRHALDRSVVDRDAEDGEVFVSIGRIVDPAAIRRPAQKFIQPFVGRVGHQVRDCAGRQIDDVHVEAFVAVVVLRIGDALCRPARNAGTSCFPARKSTGRVGRRDRSGAGTIPSDRCHSTCRRSSGHQATDQIRRPRNRRWGFERAGLG